METFSLAEEALWTPGGLTQSHAEMLMGRLLGPDIHEADLYFQRIEHESYALEDGIVKSGSFNLDQGVGVRAVSGTKTGYAYTDDLSLAPIEQAVAAARSIVRSNPKGGRHALQKSNMPRYYATDNPRLSLSANEKVDFLKQLDVKARAADPRVTQVMSHLSCVHEHVIIVTPEGIFSDVRPLVRVGLSLVVQNQQGNRETGSFGGGGRFGFDQYLSQMNPDTMIERALHQALLNLEAKPAPAGTMPVVLGPGWPGVLLHEAVGHGLEGDFNRKGASAFSGRIGEKVASEHCTVIDDGTLADRRGSLSVDDEGVTTQRTVLIENGILKGYLQDKMNARLMNTVSTGNGRRESYAYPPMPRMTNTFMMSGSYAPEEVLAAVSDGIYAVNFGGGQVDITSGKFVFTANEAYRIKNGQILYPVKGITLVGNGPEVMTKISMVADDDTLDEGVGTCGKEGQSVPVGVGLPTVLVDALTVGGTDHGA